MDAEDYDELLRSLFGSRGALTPLFRSLCAPWSRAFPRHHCLNDAGEFGHLVGEVGPPDREVQGRGEGTPAPITEIRTFHRGGIGIDMVALGLRAKPTLGASVMNPS